MIPYKIDFKISKLIKAPLDDVWEILSHPELEYKYAPDLLPSELVSCGGNEVIVKTQRSSKRGRIRSTFRATLHPKERIEWEIVAGFETGTLFTETLEEEGEATRVISHGFVLIGGFLGFLAHIFQKEAYRRVLQKIDGDLEGMKRYLESDDFQTEAPEANV